MTSLKFGEAEEPQKPALIDRSGELDAYLRQCVNINPEDIQGEFVRVSGYLAYWNTKYAEAMKNHLHAKIDTKVLASRLDPIVRQALTAAGAKLTEAMVKAAIVEHEQMVEAERYEADCEVQKNLHFGYLDAIRAKRDMLISLGAHLRAEMEGDPLIREQARARRVMDNADG